MDLLGCILIVLSKCLYLFSSVVSALLSYLAIWQGPRGVELNLKYVCGSTVPVFLGSWSCPHKKWAQFITQPRLYRMSTALYCALGHFSALCCCHSRMFLSLSSSLERDVANAISPSQNQKQLVKVKVATPENRAGFSLSSNDVGMKT